MPARPGQRMFVAVVPPPDVLAHLATAVEPYRGAVAGVRWTAVEQWHVTLAFLPAAPEAALPRLTERLARAAGRRPAMELRVAGAGAFPARRRARVLWAGVQADGDGLDGVGLGHLAGAARAAARRSGVDVAEGPFRAHVTLARLARPADVTASVEALGGYAGPAWTATDVHLIASHLGRGAGGRPRYETVAVFRLGAHGTTR